jgi:hypothetical protein
MSTLRTPSHVYPYPKEDSPEIFKWIKDFEKSFHVVVIGVWHGVSKGVIDGYRPPTLLAGYP